MRTYVIAVYVLGYSLEVRADSEEDALVAARLLSKATPFSVSIRVPFGKRNVAVFKEGERVE